MTTVRGPTAAIVEHQRPVRLENLYLVGDRSAERLHLLPTLPGDRAHQATGLFLLSWAIFAAYMTVASLRTTA